MSRSFYDIDYQNSSEENSLNSESELPDIFPEELSSDPVVSANKALVKSTILSSNDDLMATKPTNKKKSTKKADLKIKNGKKKEANAKQTPKKPQKTKDNSQDKKNKHNKLKLNSQNSIQKKRNQIASKVASSKKVLISPKSDIEKVKNKKYTSKNNTKRTERLDKQFQKIVDTWDAYKKEINTLFK